MARGDVVEDQQEVAAGSVLKIKPPSTEAWTIHNIYSSQSAEVIKCKLIAVTGESVGTGDGTTTTFTLANPPVEEQTETIYIDGVAQTRDIDYTIDYETGTITFTTAPVTGASITADYTRRLEVVAETIASGALTFFVFHVTNTNYIRVKNISANKAIIGYDGIQVV